MSTYGGDSWTTEKIHLKKRVTQLLTPSLASQEIHKLSNGTYVCKICKGKVPVFTTIQAVRVHLQGKKHTFNLDQLKLRLNEEQSFKSEIKSKPISNQIPKLTNDSLLANSTSIMIPNRSTNDNHQKSKQVDEFSYDERFAQQYEKGWRRDNKGNWYKDQGVEFDSDEEFQDQHLFHESGQVQQINSFSNHKTDQVTESKQHDQTTLEDNQLETQKEINSQFSKKRKKKNRKRKRGKKKGVKEKQIGESESEDEEKHENQNQNENEH